MDTGIPENEATGRTPSTRELQLARRVQELEQQRNALMSELHSYRTRYPQSTTVLVKPENVSTTSPATGMPPPQGDSSDLITIPHVLLPTLSLLRSHITALTRDNDALRYTFLGQASPNTSLQPVASSSKVTLDVPMTPSSSIAPLPVPQVFGRIERYGPVSDVDLEAVVGRVRELLKENEELGEMMLQAGKTGGREWQQLVDDAKDVIATLESDLDGQAGIIKGQQEELDRYRSEIERLKSACPVLPARISESRSPKSSHGSGSVSSRGGGSKGHRPGTNESTPHGRGLDRYRDREPESHNSQRQNDGGSSHTGDQRSYQDGSSERPETTGGKIEAIETGDFGTSQKAETTLSAAPAGLSIRGSHQRQQGDKRGGPQSEGRKPPDARSDGSHSEVGRAVNGNRDERGDDRNWKRRR